MDVLKALLRRLSWRLLLYWGLLAGGLWAFVELADEVYEQSGFFFDEPVLDWFYTLINPTLTGLAVALSTIGGVEVMIGLSVLTAAGLWWVSKREAVFFAFAMGGASVIMVATKYIFGRPRPELFPDVNFWPTASPSFPSGHATGSMAFFLAVYLVVAHLAPRWRVLAGLLGSVMVLGISASRLYLQVHYPSDILAGLSLGAAWVLGVNAFYTFHARDRSHRTVLLTLPAELVTAYREEARRRNEEEGEVVAEALRARFSRPVSPASNPVADPVVEPGPVPLEPPAPHAHSRTK